MPAGSKVIPGIKKLLRTYPNDSSGVTMNILNDNDENSQGRTTWLVDDLCKKNVHIAKPRVLHINLGFYLYARGDPLRDVVCVPEVLSDIIR